MLLELFPKCGKDPNTTHFALLNRITLKLGVMSGHACIRGIRVTASNVLRLLAAHHDKHPRSIPLPRRGRYRRVPGIRGYARQ